MSAAAYEEAFAAVHESARWHKADMSLVVHSVRFLSNNGLKRPRRSVSWRGHSIHAARERRGRTNTPPPSPKPGSRIDWKRRSRGGLQVHPGCYAISMR